MEVSFEQIHGSDEALDFPKRPMWNYSMSKEKLEQQEQTYFKVCMQHCTYMLCMGTPLHADAFRILNG